MTSLAPTLESFFAVRLIQQRRASPETISAYRATFRLLLGFAEHQLGKRPSALDLADLDAQLITAFLAHLEHERHNSIRTRNARLAAIARCSDTQPYATPSSLLSSNRCLLFPTSDRSEPS